MAERSGRKRMSTGSRNKARHDLDAAESGSAQTQQPSSDVKEIARQVVSETSRSCFGGLLAVLGEAWEGLRLGVDYARVSIAVVLVGGLALIVSDQGREITVRMSDDFAHAAVFYFAALWWASTAWYWARLIVDSREEQVAQLPARGRTVIEHLPRVLGLAAFLLAALLLTFSGWILNALGMLAAGVVFYSLAVKRREYLKRLDEWRAKSTRPPKAVPSWRARLRIPNPSLGRFRVGMIGLSIVIGTATFVWAWAGPVSMGQSLGSSAVLYFALASIVPAGTLIVYLTRTWGGPVLTGALVWILAAAAIDDNHGVRSLSHQVPDGSRLTLDAAISAFTAQNPGNGRTPIVVVATAGGGIRAAYWTATILGRLEDEVPAFSKSLFAISGVSGGAVGSVFYACSLVDALPGGQHEKRLQRALSSDFLAPTLAAMLYPDLAQRFLPLGFPDRAQALEHSWELAWQEVVAEAEEAEGAMAGSFFRLAPSRDVWRPLLLVNGTHQETGKRILTTPIEVSARVFADTHDFFELAPQDLRASTAANNSARFPYVSPAGTLRRGGEDTGHILDGGYFENFGAVTAREVLTALFEHRNVDSGYRPLVIQIVSDPTMTADDFDVTREPKLRGSARYVNETTAPLRAMLATRSGRGALAAKRLRQWAEDHGSYYLLNLTEPESGELPLGWVLAKTSEGDIATMLSKGRNGEQYQQLREELSQAATALAK